MELITGNDVIGLEGQNLNNRELRTLVGMADGEPPYQIAAAVDTDSMGLRHIERNIQHKLGAKSKTHIITRGFITGVLIPRALCLLLVFSTVLDTSTDMYRTGRVRNARVSAARTRTRTRKD